MDETIKVEVSVVKKKIKFIFLKLGLKEKDAQLMANALLDAEISGMESHGLMRLKPYVNGLQQKKINANPNIKITVHDSIIKVDGDNGLGQVVTSVAVDKCLEMAKKYGISAAAVTRSNHFGTGAFYNNKIASAGCIGFNATSAGATVAPFGGVEKMLGTNPFGLAFPAIKENFCADMATSVVAKGKIRIYEKKGREIPLGWALDKNGNTTTDAKAAIDGVLLPMSGHKGYALGMIVDALAGLLTNSKLSCETTPMFHSPEFANIGHFITIIDIEHFLPVSMFTGRAQNWFDKIRNSRTMDGQSILIPGEPEEIKRNQNMEYVNVLISTMEMINEYYNEALKDFKAVSTIKTL